MASKKTSSDDTTPDVETTSPTPVVAEDTPQVSQSPAAPLSFTRGVVAAGVAGLLVAGGLAGFGIARATGDDNGPEFTRIGHFRPGQQGPGWHGQDGRRGNSGGDERPSRPDRNGGPGGQQGGQPPAPSDDGADTSGT